MTSIDNIIRRTGSSTDKYDYSHEKMVVVEMLKSDEAKVLPKKPLFAIGRDIRSYVISTKNKAIVKGFLCPFSTLHYSVNLSIDYSVICTDRELMASVLCGDKNPQDKLEACLANWIRAYISNNRINDEEFITQFYKHQSNLKQFLSVEAKEKAGLVLNTEIVLENEGLLKRITINANSEEGTNWEVRVKDYSERLGLNIECGLDVDEEYKINALLKLNVEDELRQIVEQTVTRYLLDHVTLQEFKENLRTSIKKELIKRIEEACVPYGRYISFMNLTSSDQAIIPKNYPVIEHEVLCKIKNHEGFIPITNRVRVSLKNLGLFRESGIDSLKGEVNRLLDEIVQQEMFDRTYLDLILKLDEIKTSITDEFRAQMMKLGFAIKMHTIMPELEPLKLIDGFKVKRNAIFPTHDSRVEISLDVDIRGKIKDLNKDMVRGLIESQRNVEDKIIQFAIDTIENEVNILDPDKVYIDFKVSRNPEKPSVERRLKKAVRKRLEDFYIDDLTISLKIVEDKFSQHITAMTQAINLGKLNAFKVDIVSLRGEEHNEHITFEAEYKLNGIHPNGWYTFQSNMLGLENIDYSAQIKGINETLKRSISKVLNTFPIDSLRYGDYKDLGKIKLVAEEAVKEVAGELYGLSIDIVNLQRETTFWEEDIAQMNDRMAKDHFQFNRTASGLTHKSRMAELEALLEQKQKLVTSPQEDVQEELEEIEAKINKITHDTPTYNAIPNKDLKKKLGGPNTKNEFNLDDYISSNKQLGENTTNQNDEPDVTEEN